MALSPIEIRDPSDWSTGRLDVPCRCHRSHAYIDPWHAGHCCFDLYATCHPEEVAAWEEADKTYFPNGRYQH